MEDKLIKGESLVRQGADFLLQSADYAEALRCYEQSLNIARETQHSVMLVVSLCGLGTTYSRLGEFERALEYHQRAFELSATKGNPAFTGGLLIELGNDYLTLDNHHKALECYMKSLAIAQNINDHEMEMSAWGSMGIAYQKLKDISNAIKCIEESLAIAHKIGKYFAEGKGYGNLGTCYFDLGDYNKAAEYASASLKIFREVHTQLEEGQALSNLGNALRKSGSFVEAEKYFRTAIKVLEELRSNLTDRAFQKATFFELQARTYKLLQQALVAQSKFLVALEIAEQSRSRTLVELMATQSSISNSPSIEEIRDIAKVQNATLIEYSLIYDDFYGKSDSRPQHAEIFIWVIRPEGDIIYRQVDLKFLWQQQKTSLTDLILHTREFIRTPTLIREGRNVKVNAKIPTSSQEGLQQLHELLVRPIADLLPTSVEARLIFIPEGPLFFVPFPALRNGNGYLIEHHTILFSPSIRVLDLTHQRRKDIIEGTSQGALVVGNPSMSKTAISLGQVISQLPDLPYSEQEAIEIAQLLKAQAFVGKQATKNAVLSQIKHVRFIHLATHGLLNDTMKEGRMPGAIVLAASETDDGLLSSDDIMNLSLNAELVVLSACNTGLGQVLAEGIIGLSRAWIVSGVLSIIVSLWSVADDSTKFLMTNFYHFLQSYDKAQSLRRAILTTKEQYPALEDWSSFILIGEAE